MTSCHDLLKTKTISIKFLIFLETKMLINLLILQPKIDLKNVCKKEYKRVTVKSLVEMKANNEKISMLTAYDYTMAKIVDSAGVDVILVGDSASNVMAGT